MPSWAAGASKTAAAASSLLQRSLPLSTRVTPVHLPFTRSLSTSTTDLGSTPAPRSGPPTRSSNFVNSMAANFVRSPHALSRTRYTTVTPLSAFGTSSSPPSSRSLHIAPRPNLILPSSHIHPAALPSPSHRTLRHRSTPFHRFISSTSSHLSSYPPEGGPTPPAEDPTISPKDPSDPSKVTTHITDEAKATPGEDHAAVHAHRAGNLGFGFSAGGLLFGYFAGVCHSLKHHGILKPGMPIAGSSAGSLVAAAVNCGLPDEAVLESTLRMAKDCRANGTRYRLSHVLRTSLEELLPEDAHVKCSGNTFVSVTQVMPWMKAVVVSDFKSRDELISALITSCHIPWYFDGKWMARFRGGYFMDGAVLNPLPSPPGVDYTCKVCCFPSKVVNSYLSGLDIAIAPDVMEEFSYAMVDYLGWAVLPAEEASIVDLYEKGRRDGTAWARSVGLLRGKQTVAAAAGKDASSAA